MTLAFSLPKDNTYKVYLNQFINMIIDNYPNMTINGLTSDDMYDLSQGVYLASKGSVIVINSNNHYDVDWYPSKERANKDGITVNYDIANDWGQIKSFVKMYYSKNYVYSDVFGNNEPEYGYYPTSSSFPEYKSVSLPYGTPKSDDTFSTSTFVKVGRNIYPKPMDSKKTHIRIRIRKYSETPVDYVRVVRGFGFFS